MARPFVEKPVRPPASSKARPRIKRGVFGWILFIGTAILLFLFIQSSPSPALGAPAVSSPPASAFDRIDVIAIAAIIVGTCLFAGLFIYLIRVGRRAQKVIRWHFDDIGIFTFNADSEHFLPWEWVSDVATTPRGIRIDRGAAGTRFFPNDAFDGDAERQTFLDTFARRGIPSAKEVKDDGSRGFEVRA